jgi:hypothetical protein
MCESNAYIKEKEEKPRVMEEEKEKEAAKITVSDEIKILNLSGVRLRKKCGNPGKSKKIPACHEGSNRPRESLFWGIVV